MVVLRGIWDHRIIFLFLKVTYMVGLIAHDADVSCTGKQRRVHHQSGHTTAQEQPTGLNSGGLASSSCCTQDVCAAVDRAHTGQYNARNLFLSVFDLHLVGVAFGGRRCPVIECRGERFDHTLPPGDHSHHLTRQKQSILTFHHHYYS